MPRLDSDDYEELANFRYLPRKFLRFSKDFLMADGHPAPSSTRRCWQSNLVNSTKQHDDIDDEERAAKNNKSFVVTLRAGQSADE